MSQQFPGPPGSAIGEPAAQAADKRPMADLYRRFDGLDSVKPLLTGSDEDVLVRLGGKPALIRIPGSGAAPRSRLVACLLHGNEDSGFRAVLSLLREAPRLPFTLWVFIGNVRAASTGGWFAHRFLDDQEDFNRVWGVDAPTTRMRRCADAVLTELASEDLEAVVDLHNNTGDNPPYTVVPSWDPAALRLAGLCADTALLWSLRVRTLMQAFAPRCPAVAVECGLPGVPAHTAFARQVLDRFAATASFDDDGPEPAHVFAMLHRVVVRPEVPFAFGGHLDEDTDLVLRPGLDAHNFGMILAGTDIGKVWPGAAMPLCATDMAGQDVTDRYFALREDGTVVTTQDLTPAMMVRTAEQTRKDCLFYIARRRR